MDDQTTQQLLKQSGSWVAKSAILISRMSILSNTGIDFIVHYSYAPLMQYPHSSNQAECTTEQPECVCGGYFVGMLAHLFLDGPFAWLQSTGLIDEERYYYLVLLFTHTISIRMCPCMFVQIN